MKKKKELWTIKEEKMDKKRCTRETGLKPERGTSERDKWVKRGTKVQEEDWKW